MVIQRCVVLGVLVCFGAGCGPGKPTGSRFETVAPGREIEAKGREIRERPGNQRQTEDLLPLQSSDHKTGKVSEGLDVTKAFYASPKALDAIFGKPTARTKISSGGDRTPGEYREYEFGPLKKHVLARIFKGQCVMVQLELPDSFADPVEAVQSVGVDPSSVSPMAEAPLATRWTAKLGDFIFKEVSANKTKVPYDKYDMVQFELADPD
jgi:hypothetical protein